MMCNKLTIPNKTLYKTIATAFLLLAVAGFTTRAFASVSSYTSESIFHSTGVTDEQARNLQKLCKVWGFAKYTHLAFLTGEKDWDEELLGLMPVIQFAEENEVNDLLYNWFISLGDDGYDLDGLAYFSLLQESYKDIPECYDLIKAFFTDRDDFDWPSLQELNEELWLLTTGHEMNLRQMADMSWINNDYLGKPLTSVLSQFHEIRDYMGWSHVSVLSRFFETKSTNKEKAPVLFDPFGGSVFANEKSYINMDYKDSHYRLLGLFRLWNAIEYYFPHRDILEEDWNELLHECILKMQEGTDKQSYELSIAMLASKLHDAHVFFYNNSNSSFNDILGYEFGSFFAPARLTEAEGQLVVSGVDTGYKSKCPLESGDVILRLNDIAINEIIANMMQYISLPNDERVLTYLASKNVILRQKLGDIPMKIDVLRDGVELSIYSGTIYQNNNFMFPPTAFNSYMIFDNNIGLINPSKIGAEELHSIMKDLAETNGLIIDLRQYPGSEITYELAEYLLDKKLFFATMSGSLISVPGMFIDMFWAVSGSGGLADILQIYKNIGVINDFYEPPEAYFYEKKVVILMNENTKSNSEFTVMALRNGSNVTVMGSNSIGAVGNVARLPLPGGITMTFTGLGVYTSESSQTQCIGISPDIYVERTIEGIKEGKDELMEAAIQFILDNSQ